MNFRNTSLFLFASLELLGRPSPDESKPLWHSAPLVTAASPISDQPGARIIDFSGCFLRPDGEIVFWGKVAGREEKLAWALFSYRAGTLRTVLEEGEEVTSRYSTNPAQKYHVHRGGSWHASLPLREGKYLSFSCGKGMSGSESGVFVWDGEHIRPVLVPGQELTVDGQTEKVDLAGLGQPQPARETRIVLRTAKPSKRVVIGLLEGDSFHSLGMKHGELPAAAKVPANHVAVVSMDKRGAALVHKGPTDTNSLLEIGSTFPFPLASEQEPCA